MVDGAKGRDSVEAARAEREKIDEGEERQRWGEDLAVETLTEIHKEVRAMEMEIITRVDMAREMVIMVLVMAGELGEAMEMAMGLGEGDLEWAEGD